VADPPQVGVAAMPLGEIIVCKQAVKQGGNQLLRGGFAARPPMALAWKPARN